SLGGLQALTEAGIYDKARAVIGVSGGGYVGAACHVLRWNPANAGRDGEWPQPAGDPAFAPGSPEMNWLRRHTGYVLNGVRIAVQGGLSLMFGIAVNLLLLVTLLGGAAWLLAWLMLASGRRTTWDGTSMDGAFTDEGSFL